MEHSTLDALNLREVMVFLTAAGVLVPLAHRLKVSPVLGFLIIGIIIGPYGLARFTDSVPWLSYIVIDDADGVSALAELGVIFLLFMIGLELSLDRLWAMRRLVFGLGGLQVIFTGAVIAIIASFFDNTLPAAVVLGCGFALSSTAIGIQLLSENRRLGTATGQTSFSILLFQDLAVLPILFLVAAFGADGEGSVIVAFAIAIGSALVAVAVILVVGRLVIRPLFQFVGSTANRDMFIAFVLLVIGGIALATEQFGLSMALGAFLAGLLFAETEYRYEIEVDIEPFKGLLLGLFFVSVGMSVDLAQIAAKPVWLFASVVGLYAIKTPIIYALARVFGEPRSVALESGLLLGQAGEFAFLVVGLAATLGLMPDDTVQFMLIVTGIAMIATPGVAHIARRLARRVEIWEAERGQTDSDMPSGLAGHVIIVGYGRVGQMLGTVLDQQELTYVGLDSDASIVSTFRPKGAGVFYGDANRPDLLKKLGIERAAALVVTMDSPAAVERVVNATQRYWPHLTIYARARDKEHAVRLVACGASHVIPETTEASLQLGEMLLVQMGVPMQAANRMIEAQRQAEQAAVDESHSKKAGKDLRADNAP